MAASMMKPYSSIRRIRGCSPGSSLSLLLLLLLSFRPTAAMSRIEGVATDLTAAASTYSVASAASAASAMQQRSRRKRSLVFPTGSDLSFNVGLSIPIAALSATSELFLWLRDSRWKDSEIALTTSTSTENRLLRKSLHTKSCNKEFVATHSHQNPNKKWR